ncbi:MAG: hypothetical protein JEZ14_13310 [Marinilabiliaceae bacterium]|nr:hypothetical protein [Marinilabiliaceae bacterium]
MKVRIFLFIGLLFSNMGLAQVFKENSVGIVFLRCERAHTYELEIVFPIDFVSGISSDALSSENKTSYPGVYNENGIELIDGKGKLGEIKLTNYIFKRWCEKEAGFHYRPTFQGEIAKSDLKRPLQASAYYDITCFALINHRTGKEQCAIDQDKPVIMNGDTDTNGWADVWLWLKEDEFHNCEGDKDSIIILEVNHQSYEMNCCAY